MKRALLAFAGVLVALAPAFGTDSASIPGPCYDIVMRGGNVVWLEPDGAILIDRCSGATWLLERETVDSKGAATLRWRPLGTENSEPLFPPVALPTPH